MPFDPHLVFPFFFFRLLTVDWVSTLPVARSNHLSRHRLHQNRHLTVHRWPVFYFFCTWPDRPIELTDFLWLMSNQPGRLAEQAGSESPSRQKTKGQQNQRKSALDPWLLWSDQHRWQQPMQINLILMKQRPLNHQFADHHLPSILVLQRGSNEKQTSIPGLQGKKCFLSGDVVVGVMKWLEFSYQEFKKQVI